MTTPTGAADDMSEHDRIDLNVAVEFLDRIAVTTNASNDRCGQIVDRLRADAETIQSLQAWKELHQAAAVELFRTQLAAQSAELERVRKDAERYRWLRQRMCIRFEEAMNGQKRPAFNMRIGHAFVDSKQILQPNNIDAERVDSSIDAALAAPSAAGGYKEPSEAQMFGGDLYSGIKP